MIFTQKAYKRALALIRARLYKSDAPVVLRWTTYWLLLIVNELSDADDFRSEVYDHAVLNPRGAQVPK